MSFSLSKTKFNNKSLFKFQVSAIALMVIYCDYASDLFCLA